MANKWYPMFLVLLRLYKIHGYGTIHRHGRPIRQCILSRYMILDMDLIFKYDLVKINDINEEYTSISCF